MDPLARWDARLGGGDDNRLAGAMVVAVVEVVEVEEVEVEVVVVVVVVAVTGVVAQAQKFQCLAQVSSHQCCKQDSEYPRHNWNTD